jgi:plastocyanin
MTGAVMSPATILWLEVAMGAGVLTGAALARLRRFRVHGWLQGAIVGFNGVVIAFAMIPSLIRYLRFPTRLRIANHKHWMRVGLGAWLIAVALGAWTYQTLNGSGNGRSGLVTARALPSSSLIIVKNFGFDPAEITVATGAEVEWTDQGGRHSVQADDGSFKSETMMAGGKFKHRFDRPGVYRYFCEFLGAAGGHDIAGVVFVK